MYSYSMRIRTLLLPSSLGALMLVAGSADMARADLAPPRVISRTPKPPPPVSRDAVSLARRDPVIAKQLVAARGTSAQNAAPVPNETAVQVTIGGQCGFAGCSSQTLVAFTFRSSGANTTTQSVLALVTCPPVQSQPCSVAPAEVRAASVEQPQK